MGLLCAWPTNIPIQTHIYLYTSFVHILFASYIFLDSERKGKKFTIFSLMHCQT